jgi:hypothetical protein
MNEQSATDVSRAAPVPPEKPNRQLPAPAVAHNSSPGVLYLCSKVHTGIVPASEAFPEAKLQTANAKLQRNLKPQAPLQKLRLSGTLASGQPGSRADALCTGHWTSPIWLYGVGFRRRLGG